MLTVPEEVSLRPMKCELNPLNKPDGSAILSQGKTVIIASVHGPVESKSQRLQFDKVSFDTVYQAKTLQPDVTEGLYECRVQEACEAALFPNSYVRNDITLVIQEMQNRGGVLACAINAGCLALINSGLDLRYLVGAICCMIDNDDKIIVDPDEEACKKSRAVLTFAFENTSGELVMADVQGSCSRKEFNKLATISREIVQKKIFPFYKSIVEKYCSVLI